MLRLSHWLFRKPFDRKPAATIRRTRLGVEGLETRDCPATATNILGLWTYPGSWDTNAVPTAGDDVIIDESIQVPTGYPVAVNSITVNWNAGYAFLGTVTTPTLTVVGSNNTVLGPSTIGHLTHGGGEWSWLSMGTSAVGTLDWSSGMVFGNTILDTGVPDPVTVQTLNITAEDYKQLLGVLLKTAGTVNWANGEDVRATNRGGFENQPGATFNLPQTGDMTDSSFSYTEYDDGNIFRNKGTLTEWAGGTRAFHPTVFEQTSTGTVNMELKSVAGTLYDRINSSTLNLGGTLNVSLLPGYSVSAGDVFTIMTGARTGTFGTVNLPSLPNGLSMKVVYEANAVLLVVTPKVVLV